MICCDARVEGAVFGALRELAVVSARRVYHLYIGIADGMSIARVEGAVFGALRELAVVSARRVGVMHASLLLGILALLLLLLLLLL